MSTPKDYNLEACHDIAIAIIEVCRSTGFPENLADHWIAQAMGVMEEQLTQQGPIYPTRRVISFDASTTAVGWAIRDPDGTLTQGVMIPDKRCGWFDRILIIEQWVPTAMRNLDVVLYETASGGATKQRGVSKKVDRMMGMVEFVFRKACLDADAKFTPMTTSQIKSSGLYKNPGAAADWVGQELNARTKKTRQDVADALGMLKYYEEKVDK